jgi:Patatin-like phospholipase
VTVPTWHDKLTPYNADGIVLFGREFLQRWGRQEWTPHDDPASVDDITAATKMHVQLVSRITTQRLPYADGVEAAALKSVYQLFGEAREIFNAHSKCRLADAISWYVLNTHVRPFTAKWHRQSERGGLSALDATDIFRSELYTLQLKLTRFDALLVEIRDGLAPPSGPAANESDDERRIAEEMGMDVEWRIDKKLGGLREEMAMAINVEEKRAVTARRQHYRPRPITLVTAAQADDPALVDGTNNGEHHPPQSEGRPSTEPPEWEAWRNRPHAVALAISGGGIRSATFALGVLVALARRNLLYQFDYLSTVSGGGYLGAFLTTFLNAEDAADQTTPIGLRRDELPFRRDDGEAAALRHVRHHSKYLATGRLWERLQMAFAQVYGMAMNGLGFAYLAVLAALTEFVIRLYLPIGSFWPVPILVVATFLGIVSFLIPLLMRGFPEIRRHADALLAWPVLGLFALFAWQGLESSHGGYAYAVGQGWELWLIGVAAIPLIASAVLALGGELLLPVRIVLIVFSAIAAPLLFFEIELAAFATIGGSITLPVIGAVGGAWVAAAIAAVGVVLWNCFDVNFTASHRHYKKKLGEAYLVQPTTASGELRQDVPLLLSKCADKARAPYHLVNCALNVPGSKNPAMQGRLTDFFLFSPAFCGSPLTGYESTVKWESLDGVLDLGTAMAISGAAAAPQMGTGTLKNFSFWLALFNVRLGYWVRNPRIAATKRGSPPGLSYLLQEMFGWADETRPYVNLSDGGHIENLGVYELLRRRCKYIVAIDGEQDPKMTFGGLTTLQRLAAIDLGVTIDIGVDQLRLGEKGLSHSHFTFCRINYPEGTRDEAVSHGYLIYLKLSLTGNEGEFIRRYKLDEPNFPHHSTADQFFTEAQFEAYRSLGEHVGDKMFLPAIVGSEIATSNDVELEKWFLAIGKNMLDPLEEKRGTA